MPHKYGFSPCLRTSEKRNLLREYFFAKREAEMAKSVSNFACGTGKRAAGSHNKFRCGISERIAKLATTGFPREKLPRHVISFIARHVHAVLREIFTTISGRNWYCDSPFVTLRIVHVPYVRFSYDIQWHDSSMRNKFCKVTLASFTLSNCALSSLDRHLFVKIFSTNDKMMHRLRWSRLINSFSWYN